MATASPSLNALRAVETTVRLGSLSLAARELVVSVPAVAQQIRNAEDALGIRLAARQGRGLWISPEARILAGQLGTAFQLIDRAVIAASGRTRPTNVVTISVLTNFAALWLLPRLTSFRDSNPEVDVRIATSERKVDLGREGVDCAVRVGDGNWNESRQWSLFPQVLAPVAHRSYLERHGLSSGLDDIGHHRLIRDINRADEWSEWLAVAGIDRAPTGFHEVSGREMVAETVMAGLGIGLLDLSLIDRRLRSGEMVQLFPKAYASGWCHYLIVSAESTQSIAREAFIAWLRAEAGQTAALLEAQDGLR